MRTTDYFLELQKYFTYCEWEVPGLGHSIVARENSLDVHSEQHVKRRVKQKHEHHGSECVAVVWRGWREKIAPLHSLRRALEGNDEAAAKGHGRVWRQTGQ